MRDVNTMHSFKSKFAFIFPFELTTLQIEIIGFSTVDFV